MSKLKIVQAGVGGHGKAWVRVLKDHPEAECVGVVDVNPEALSAAGEALDLPADRRFDDLERALEQVECDAVLSVTPPPVHPVHAEVAASAGRHLLVEKPLAEDMASAKRMVERFESAGLQLAVAQQRRYDADMRLLRQIVREKPVGEIGHLHLDFYIPADFRGTFRQSMRHVLLVDMVVHHFDLIRSVTGRDVERVYATSFNPPGSDYEHGAALKMVMILQGGVPASYSGDWSAKGAVTSWQGDWRVQCAGGSIRLGKDTGGVVVDEGGVWQSGPTATHVRPVPTAENAAAAQALLLSDFAQAARSGGPAPTSGRDNLQTVAAVFAAVQSAETGKVVEVSSLL